MWYDNASFFKGLSQHVSSPRWIMNGKTISLLSGGLEGTLATRLMMEQ
jgi:hypothetical protein